MRGIERMVEDERYCIDILTQISAIQAALDKVGLRLLEHHATHCVIGAEDPAVRDERTGEMMAAVGAPDGPEVAGRGAGEPWPRSRGSRSTRSRWRRPSTA